MKLVILWNMSTKPEKKSDKLELGKLSQTGREKEKKGHSPPYGDCDNSQK
jgi:hypothetical protein